MSLEDPACLTHLQPLQCPRPWPVDLMTGSPPMTTTAVQALLNLELWLHNRFWWLAKRPAPPEAWRADPLLGITQAQVAYYPMGMNQCTRAHLVVTEVSNRFPAPVPRPLFGVLCSFDISPQVTEQIAAQLLYQPYLNPQVVDNPLYSFWYRFWYELPPGYPGWGSCWSTDPATAYNPEPLPSYHRYILPLTHRRSHMQAPGVDIPLRAGEYMPGHFCQPVDRACLDAYRMAHLHHWLPYQYSIGPDWQATRIIPIPP